MIEILYVKQDAQFLEQVKKKLDIADNVIYISPGLCTHVSQNIIYLTLDVCHQVDISHNRNLESFLIAVSDDSKHQVVVRMKKPLIKKENSIQYSKVGIILDVGNDF